jgi:hypothetical protein
MIGTRSPSSPRAASEHLRIRAETGPDLEYVVTQLDARQPPRQQLVLDRASPPRRGADEGVGRFTVAQSSGASALPCLSVVTAQQARALALALPGTLEQDHHGRPSFRVAGKIFATPCDQQHLNVMLDEGGILTAVQSDPEGCAERWWGKRLAAVSVTLSRIDPDALAELLTDAWEGKAPAAARQPRDSRAHI